MAELSYDDVRRAAQDAVRELMRLLTGLKTNSDDIRRGVQQSSGAQKQLSDLALRVNLLQDQITNLDSTVRVHNDTIYMLQNLNQTIDELKRRIVASEEFIRFIYTYCNTQQEQRRDHF